MQKLGLIQTLSQKLSPQQIQFIKLLQVPTVELETRIEEELEINPALEEGREEPDGSRGSPRWQSRGRARPSRSGGAMREAIHPGS